MTWKYKFTDNNESMEIYDHNNGLVKTVTNNQAPRVRYQGNVPIEPDFKKEMRSVLEEEFNQNGVNNYIFNAMMDIADNSIEEY